MNTKLKALLAGSVLIPALAACSLTPAYTRPDVQMPAQWDRSGEGRGGDVVAAGWWKRFGNAELDELIAQSLAANHDLPAAGGPLQQRRGTSKSARRAPPPQRG